VLGEPTRAALRKEELVVSEDIKDAVATLHESRFDPEYLLDLSRQTGGLGKVVSTRAVGNRDLHSDSIGGLRLGPRQSGTTAEGYVDR
jgi:hypothetical protein